MHFLSTHKKWKMSEIEILFQEALILLSLKYFSFPFKGQEKIEMQI